MRIRDFSLASKLIIAQAVTISMLLAVVIYLLTSMVSRQVERKSFDELRKTNHLVVDMIDAYSRSLQQNTNRLECVFGASLPGRFSLDESKTVAIGDQATPLLRTGGIPLNLNFEQVDRFSAVTGCVATIFARQGDDFVRITTSLKKHKSEIKESARTDFERIRLERGFSLIRAFPFTGRFHQIRRHFASSGHALVGDPKYGSAQAWSEFFRGREPHLMLQAESLSFIHPVTRKNISIKTKEPFTA